MTVKTTIDSEVTSAADFIRQNGKDEGGWLELSKSDYFSYMSNQGITRKTLEQIAEANSNLANGALLVAGERCAEAVTAARKDGKKTDEEISRIVGEVRVATIEGRLKVPVRAHATFPNPRTGEKVDSYGSSRPKLEIRSGMRHAVNDAVTEMVKNAFSS